jgi:dolichol-phosphate mannosyltransferase
MMEQQEDGQIAHRDLIPTVILCESSGEEVEQLRAQVRKALKQAGVEFTVLVGGSDWPAELYRKPAAQRASPSLRPPIEFSIVVPIYNEEENIPELYRRLTEVMTGIGQPYELVFVDDGSRDQSLDLLLQLYAGDPSMRVIKLARNFGHQRAVSGGLDHSYGSAVIVMDGDLQDPPEVIPQFVDKWREGHQVVYAIREKRKEHVLKRAIYHSFYILLRTVSRVDIPLEAGDFCLMDRCVVDELIALPERNRFVRGLRSWVGFKQVGLGYERNARYAGEPKYTFRQLVSLALDGLISFSYLPLRLATLLGFAVSAWSLLAAAYYFVKRLTVGVRPPGLATMVVLILFLGGVQLITVGVIGEYIGHILEEVKGRPTYVVDKVFERRGLTE